MMYAFKTLFLLVFQETVKANTAFITPISIASGKISRSYFNPCSSWQQRQKPHSRLYAMDVKIRIVGKKKSNGGDQKWLEDAYSVYEKRLKPSGLKVETVWHKNDEDLLKNVNADASKGHAVVYLDPAIGKSCTSEKFSTHLYRWLTEGGSRLSFVIGGADGLPPELKTAASSGRALSLSELTFTHQFARTLLMEQIYRATEIKKGSGYHK